jgi:hypothetical protein
MKVGIYDGINRQTDKTMKYLPLFMLSDFRESISFVGRSQVSPVCPSVKSRFGDENE